MWFDTFQSIIDPITDRHSFLSDGIAYHRPISFMQGPSSSFILYLFSLSLPSSSICPSEATYSGIAPRHSWSDVCPGCLIQRLQKYSVREAATTQSPLPLLQQPHSPSFRYSPPLLLPLFQVRISVCVEFSRGTTLTSRPEEETVRRISLYLADYSQGREQETKEERASYPWET